MSRSLRWVGLVVAACYWCAVQPAPVAAQDGKLKFEMYKDGKEEYRWRLKSSNGKVLATAGQGFKSKRSCETSIDNIKNGAGSDKYKFEPYEDNKGEHRWRLVASNGQTVASSSQGYSNKADCDKAIALIKSSAKKAKVEEVTAD
jgi:uncharacterized protein YegP (UPF0339 family)